MPSIVGKYQHYKNEDIEDYFTVVGVPFMGRKMMAASSPLMEISIDGDIMTVKSTSMFRKVEHSFKLGEEYEEKMMNGVVLKSVTKIVNDNEVVTESIMPAVGGTAEPQKCGRSYYFTDDECVVTLTHEKAKPGKRYFKRVKPIN